MLRAVTDADPTATEGGRDRSLRPRAARSHVGKACQHGRGAGYLALREDVIRQSVKLPVVQRRRGVSADGDSS